jgi:hypothetical protein
MLLRRYLLGQANEEEQRVVEHSLLAEQEYFDQLLRCEEELIDEYACGAMKGADKECFEKHFLATPERRESVAFAQAMLRYFASRKRSRAGAGEIFPAHSAADQYRPSGDRGSAGGLPRHCLFMTPQLRQQVEQNWAELSRAEQRRRR